MIFLCWYVCSIACSTLFPTHRFLPRAVDGLVTSGGDNRSAEDEAIKIETKTVSLKDLFGQLRGTTSSFPPIVLNMKRQMGSSFAIGLCIATAFLVFIMKAFMGKNMMTRFNNPIVKVGKNNSTVEMGGKVYRLALVTLTERGRELTSGRDLMYSLKKGTQSLLSPDFDPDTVQWIPANHPFSTTARDIDEYLAQINRLIPAMLDFERAFKSYPKSPEQRGEKSFLNGRSINSKPSSSERSPISSRSTSS
ncbi:hypothetical protein UlMin_025010 [Ulmus minor]